MARKSIPERNPIGDAFTGRLIKIDDKHLLVPESEDIGEAQVIANQMFTVRYGVRFLGKPHISIVPGIIALDYGDMLTDEDAWHFLLKKSNLHPRADVVGYRHDGTDDMIQVKWLDLALPFEVLVYADDQATKPLTAVQALIAPDNNDIPPRIGEYLPRYASIANWKTKRTK